MTTTQTPLSLAEQYARFRQDHPTTRIRDAATALGVSEAQLLATRCGQSVRRLEGEFTEILKEFHQLGNVMTLTRNDHCVHEKKGLYQPVDIQGIMGVVTDKGIDLRLFMRRWHMGFAVNDEGTDGNLKRSFQFFDMDGQAIHKVFVLEADKAEIFEALVQKYLSLNQSTDQEVHPVVLAENTLGEKDVDKSAFLEKWGSLKDTHGFFGLLKKFNVSRTTAMRLAEGTFTRRIRKDSHRGLLEYARDHEVPIMVFVGSPGVIQIHTGPVKNLKVFKDWYNVLDPEFNLHLLETGIAEAWAVEKVTTDGVVTSVELFDQKGNEIALFFGERKPGQPELEAWRELVKSLN